MGVAINSMPKNIRCIPTKTGKDDITQIITEKDKTFINIIYLFDTTYSMKKNKSIIESFKSINESLKKEYQNIQFGFILYKDFDLPKDSLELNQRHIKVYPPSKDSFLKEEIIFYGGNDFAEDWANAYYELSQLVLDKKYQNIVIHFCDAGAHGKKFSDYDDKNNQEKLLIQALNKCAEKKFKIIGLLYNDFSRKSFVTCAKLYEGYYKIEDLTYFDILNYLVDFQKNISDNIKYALKNDNNLTKINNNYRMNAFRMDSEIKGISQLDNYSIIEGFENDFNWKNKNINMKKLKCIKNKYNNLGYYIFLPILNGSDVKKINEFIKSAPTPVYDENKDTYNNKCFVKTGIKQGSICDCYLIASIISILYSKIPLTEYIFPENNYNQDSENIEMNIYENGIRKLITFKNTYATYYENIKKKINLFFHHH